MKQTIAIILLNFSILFSGLHAGQLEDVFSDIYNRGEWGVDESGQGTSGDGSTAENTKLYRFFLQDFLNAKQIKTVVDFGCGDWEFSQLIDWTDINYIGIDVVKSVIDQNQARFGSDNISFIHADALSLDLPPADLLLCKDVLQHLPFSMIHEFLVQTPKFKHCLITNCVDAHSLTCNNINIPEGHYRMLDLTKRPFHVSGLKLFTYLNPGKDLTAKQVLYIYNP